MARPKKPQKARPANWKGTAHLPATKLQIRTLHTLQGKLHMDEESYRIVIARHGLGVIHTNDLNRKQASAAISELSLKLDGAPKAPTTAPSRRTKRGQAKPEPVTSKGNVVALATPPQLLLIKHLVDEINWHPHGGNFEAWLKKNQGVEKVVTKEQARNVIEGLKGLKRHGHAAPQP